MKSVATFFVWMGLLTLVFGITSAAYWNFIIGAVQIGVSLFLILIGVVINNNDILREEYDKYER